MRVKNRFLVTFMLALVFMASIIFYSLSMLERHTNLLTIIVSEDGAAVESIMFLQALYPDGFKTIYAGVSAEGKFDVQVNVDELKSAWDARRSLDGTYSQPSFAAVIFTSKSIDDFIFMVSWEELRRGKTITIEPRFKRWETVNVRDVRAMYGELLDRYEEAGKVTLMRAETNAHSRATIQVGYEAGRALKVSVDVFFFEIGEWQIGGYAGISSSTPYSLEVMVNENQIKRISINATYRWEHWRWYWNTPNGTVVEEEYRVYWANFKPETLSWQEGEDVNVNYRTIDIRNGIGFEYSMYSEMSDTHYTYKSAVDAGWFINVLTALGKIKHPAAIITTLIVDLQVKYESYEAMKYAFAAYGAEDHTFYIDKGESTLWNAYKASYFKIRE
ncbi:MAG: hypothetical protein QW592_03835 [Candidatus Bathyarchaeia archaeon]